MNGSIFSIYDQVYNKRKDKKISKRLLYFSFLSPKYTCHANLLSLWPQKLFRAAATEKGGDRERRRRKRTGQRDPGWVRVGLKEDCGEGGFRQEALSSPRGSFLDGEYVVHMQKEMSTVFFGVFSLRVDDMGGSSRNLQTPGSKLGDRGWLSCLKREGMPAGACFGLDKIVPRAHCCKAVGQALADKKPLALSE